MIKKKLFLGVIFVLATITAVAQKNVIDEVIWVVGDEAILLSDVENQRLLMQNEGMRFEGDPYCFIPEQIAIQKLFLSQAKIDSVYANESMVLRYVDRWINNAISQMGSVEKLEEYWGGKKISQIKEEQKKYIRDQQVVEEMRNKITGNIRLTPSDVRKYFSQIPKDSLPMIPTTVEIGIVVMEPKIPIEDIDAIKSRLRTFTEQINNGEYTFAALAGLYSEDMGSAMRGGEIGTRAKIELSPEYANVAFSLSDPNRISNIVETEYGFHIIQLIEKRGDRINTRHILLRPKVSEQEVTKAIERLDTLYKDIIAEKLTFDEAATYISVDKDTRNNKGLMINKDEESQNINTPKFEMEELPQGMGVVIDKMQVGEISKPFRMKNSSGKDVVAIVKLRSRINAHQANVSDDFQTLKALVENKKREEVLNAWIISKQKTTYMRISEGWRKCDFKYPGWIKE